MTSAGTGWTAILYKRRKNHRSDDADAWRNGCTVNLIIVLFQHMKYLQAMVLGLGIRLVGYTGLIGLSSLLSKLHYWEIWFIIGSHPYQYGQQVFQSLL